MKCSWSIAFFFTTLVAISSSQVGQEKCQAVPKGHLEIFGSHADATETIDEMFTVPQPQEFFDKFVKPNKPVLLRGAARPSRAYSLWTPEFLIREYGNLTVRLEARHEANHKIPAGETGLGRDTVAHFMRNFDTMDAYAISQIPRPMEKDVAVPPCLRCGSIAQGIQETHLFLTAAGGKTMVHRDPYSTFHCLFNGTKDWILVDPSQSDLLYFAEDSRYEWGGYSEINVDSVDLLQFPKIRDVRFARITMDKGDCIFVPGGYPHQVRVNGYLNTAVSIWISRLKEFDNAGCDQEFDFTPMDQVDVLWRYSGHGDLPQGHMDIHILRRLLLLLADSEGKISVQHFLDNFIKGRHEMGDEFEEDHRMSQEEIKTMDKLYSNMKIEFAKKVDPEGRGYITTDEVKALTREEMKDIMLIIDPTDVSDTSSFEYSHIQVEAIRTLLQNLMSKNGGQLSSDVFVQEYVERLGGTAQVAEEIVAKLVPNKDATLTAAMVQENMAAALQPFDSARAHDPTLERLMYKHLEMHDEL
ncbi:PREDICTED: uncharacterized protein LOC109463450 [Branchiostoma belcheri]|uniref:Uncharacterized protein LOC109463450 n=1 Tax=Branchiostoma belcheri TaxID=7741 RepID=A0A6P4XUT5_BRABE|nr:PREDICTED: uncharacterized protein LOC109463450 [Branchiostoma belcheri]